MPENLLKEAPNAYRAPVPVVIEDAIPANQADPPIDFEAAALKLWAGRKIILLAGVAAMLLAAILAFLIPPSFVSVVSFLPPSSSSSSNANALMGQLSLLSGLGGGSGLFGGAKTPGDLYVGILKSHSIASELVKRFDLQRVYKVKKESKAEKLLAAHSTFDVGLKDSIVTIAVTDTSPARARDMANAYFDALRETNSRLALVKLRSAACSSASNSPRRRTILPTQRLTSNALKSNPV